MPRAAAHIETDHPSRYLVHLCQHATKVSHKLRLLHAQAGAERPEVLDVEWTDTDATLTLNWGTCTLHAGGNMLTVHAEAADEAALKRVQDIITADLERFGRRDHLTVNWTRLDTPPGAPRPSR
jgi:hypothetical protein